MSRVSLLNFQYVLVFAAGLIFFFSFRSLWLDDWDSVLFAKALEEIDLSKHHPHPPGYVAYIFTARLLFWVLGDAQLSLVLTSNLAAAASLTLCLQLGRALKSPLSGVLAALVLFLSPAFIQGGLIAMADIVMTPFLIGAAVCLTHGLKKRYWVRPVLIICGGFCLGWGVGIRPQSVFLFSTLALIFLISYRGWIDRTVLICSGLVATLFWLIPIAVRSGGLIEYFNLCKNQFSAHPNARNKFSGEEFWVFIEKFFADWNLQLISLTFLATISFSFLVFIQFKSQKKDSDLRVFAILAFLTIAGAFTTLIFHPLDFKRVLIPSLVPFSFLVGFVIAKGFQFIPKTSGLFFLSLFSLTFTILCGSFQSFSRAISLHRSLPPAIEASHTISSIADPDQAVIWTDAPYRHLFYYLPDYTLPGERSKSGWSPRFAKPGKYHLFTDSLIQGSTPYQRFHFKRDPRIYFKGNKLNLFHYLLPQINVYLDSGVYQTENWGFWTQEKFSGWVRKSINGESHLNLTIHSAGRNPKTMNVQVDGKPVWSGMIPETDISLKIPLTLGRNWLPFSVETPDGSWVPADAGNSNDTRPLAFAIKRIEVGNKTLAVGHKLKFFQGSSGLYALGEGWSAPEEQWTWSQGDESTIRVFTANGFSRDLYLVLDGRFFVAPENSKMSFEILINGQLVKESNSPNNQFHQIRLRIPESIQRSDSLLEISFKFKNLYSPKQHGLSNDSRLLGFALRQLWLELDNSTES